MTYAAFKTAVKATVFPEGEAANLSAVHDKYVLDCLIDLQQKVPCQQAGHRTTYTHDVTLFDNGATVFEAPRGFIKQLYTVLASDCSARIDYVPVSEDEMIGLVNDQNKCGTRWRATSDYSDEFGYMYYDGCKAYVGTEVDKVCRAQTGVFALANGQIYVYPQIQSTESIVLRWDGINRSWDDADEAVFDREVQDLVELYLEAKARRRDDQDMEAAGAALALYNDKIAHLAWQCQKEMRLPRREPYFSNCYPWNCRTCS